MIRSLRGVIENTHPLHLIISVSGVGYLVYMNTLRGRYEVGDTVHVFTHLAVRETALDLYGFPTTDELAFFELLLTIPKIGPKSALQILNQAEPAVLTEAIRARDAGYLHKVSGIGKKTAENIVQFLHDKLEGVSFVRAEIDGDPIDRNQSDAIDALISLGYNPADARSSVRALTEKGETTDLIKQALKNLSGR